MNDNLYDEKARAAIRQVSNELQILLDTPGYLNPVVLDKSISDLIYAIRCLVRAEEREDK